MVHLTHTTADLCQKVCVFLVNVKKDVSCDHSRPGVCLFF